MLGLTLLVILAEGRALTCKFNKEILDLLPDGVAPLVSNVMLGRLSCNLVGVETGWRSLPSVLAVEATELYANVCNPENK